MTRIPVRTSLITCEKKIEKFIEMDSWHAAQSLISQPQLCRSWTLTLSSFCVIISLLSLPIFTASQRLMGINRRQKPNPVRKASPTCKDHHKPPQWIVSYTTTPITQSRFRLQCMHTPPPPHTHTHTPAGGGGRGRWQFERGGSRTGENSDKNWQCDLCQCSWSSPPEDKNEYLPIIMIWIGLTTISAPVLLKIQRVW